MNYRWKRHADDSCPTCIMLNGVVRSEQEWQRLTLAPGSPKLYCKDKCQCSLEATEDDPEGEIDYNQIRLLSEGHDHMTDITLQLTANPTDEGFNILAINEGEAKGHGITFAAPVLQSAVGLYEAKPVFIDHAGLFEAPSVRNLAGTLQGARWNEQEKGIEARLKPSGPAADVLLSIRDAAKSDPAIMQAVGFSTVLNVKLDAKGNVTKIIHVKSVDVVIDPARGGKFLSAFNSGQKGDNMTDQIPNQSAETLTPEQTAALELQGARNIMSDLQVQAEQGNEILLAQCATLLDTSLAASKLPAASQKVIRKMFDGRIFKATELQEAITEKRDELAELSAAETVRGPARTFSGFMNTADQFRLAVEDLFGVERDPKDANARVHRLSGLREAYLMATGDNNFVGGFYPEYALVTANFPGIVANVQNKILVKAWQEYEQVYGWWKNIVTVEHFTTLNQISWVKTGTIASLPEVAEQGEYQELPIGDNKETSDWTKYGGYVPLTIEAVLRDDLRAFKRLPREVALGGIRNISEQVAAIFTDNSGAGPTLADTGALFNATAVTTAGGHANLLTTALGTDFTAWDAVATAVYNQPLLVKNESGKYGTGKKMGIEPKYCLVPRALKAAAEALFIPRWASTVEAAIASKGGPTYGGYVTPLTIPEWTDTTDWAAVVDPALVPGIMIGEIFGVMPQIFSASSETDPAMFANDESRIKVRQFLAVGVADFRPLHKSNVAG